MNTTFFSGNLIENFVSSSLDEKNLFPFQHIYLGVLFIIAGISLIFLFYEDITRSQNEKSQKKDKFQNEKSQKEDKSQSNDQKEDSPVVNENKPSQSPSVIVLEWHDVVPKFELVFTKTEKIDSVNVTEKFIYEFETKDDPQVFATSIEPFKTAIETYAESHTFEILVCDRTEN